MRLASVEEEGLRCSYHGWLHNTQGQCIYMPCETEEYRRRMDVWHPAYPTTEYGGLVFVYMGPPGSEPLFPMYDIIDTRDRNDVVLRGMRLWGDYSVGFVRDCNWLQHYENIVDPWHLLVLHQLISGDQFEGPPSVSCGPRPVSDARQYPPGQRTAPEGPLWGDEPANQIKQRRQIPHRPALASVRTLPAVSSLEAFRTPASVHLLAPGSGRHPKTVNERRGSLAVAGAAVIGAIEPFAKDRLKAGNPPDF